MSYLKAEYKDGEMNIETHGDLIDTVKDACLVIGSIYHGMKNSRPAEALLFKIAVRQAIMDESIIWKYEADKGTCIDIKTK